MYVGAPRSSHSLNGRLWDPAPSRSTAFSAHARNFEHLGFSKRTLVVMAAALSSAMLFVIVFAAVHCVCRHFRPTQEKQEQQDIEKSLRRAEIARLVRDSDIPARPNEMQRSASTSRIPMRKIDDDELAMPPLLPVRTAPPVFRTYEPLGPVERVRSPTRNPLGTRAPGVGGRVANRVRQIEEAAVQKPMQIYDPERRRTVYLG